MKIYLIILLVFFSCTHSRKSETNAAESRIDTVQIVKTDTVFVHKTDTVFVAKQSDSLRAVIRSLNDQLFIANYRVERARYYLKIVQRNPSQLKFLVSWINRALK